MASGLSQAALAAAAGVRRSSVAQWESSGGTMPAPGHMALIAAKTGVQFEWLATGRGPQHPGGVEPFEREIFGIANSDLESRMLDAMKVLCRSKQEKALRLIEVLFEA